MDKIIKELEVAGKEMRKWTDRVEVGAGSRREVVEGNEVGGEVARKAGMKWVDRAEEEGNGVAEGGEKTKGTVGGRWEMGGGRK